MKPLSQLLSLLLLYKFDKIADNCLAFSRYNTLRMEVNSLWTQFLYRMQIGLFFFSPFELLYCKFIIAVNFKMAPSSPIYYKKDRYTKNVECARSWTHDQIVQ